MEDKLLKKIEKQRNKMIVYSRTHDLTDPGTVELSQKLDKLLNKHLQKMRHQQLRFW